MYIGGTDNNALHHLAFEILDNSMDEVVAKHATTINVNLLNNNTISISDNGRGIPIDNHPKFKNKSALEIIMTTHSGGKFTNKSYKTSGGLHGVGASVVNALSSFMKVEVIRGGYLYVQEFSRGLAISPLTKKDKVRKTILEHLLLLNLILKYLVKIIFLILLKFLICWKIKLIFLKVFKSIGNVMRHF